MAESHAEKAAALILGPGGGLLFAAVVVYIFVDVLTTRKPS